MKLKKAFIITSTSHTFVIIGGLISLVLCIFTLRNIYLVIGIAVMCFLFWLSTFIRKWMINFFLKRVKYPYELLAILELNDLLMGFDILWDGKQTIGLSPSPSDTKEYLRDNDLETTVPSKQDRSRWVVLLSAASLIPIVLLFDQKRGIDTNTAIIITAVIVAVNIFTWRKAFSRPAKLNYSTGIKVTDTYLQLGDNIYPWKQITGWKYKSDEDDGTIQLSLHNDLSNHPSSFRFRRNEIDETDLQLLLVHYYGKHAIDFQPLEEENTNTI